MALAPAGARRSRQPVSSKRPGPAARREFSTGEGSKARLVVGSRGGRGRCAAHSLSLHASLKARNERGCSRQRWVVPRPPDRVEGSEAQASARRAACGARRGKKNSPSQSKRTGTQREREQALWLLFAWACVRGGDVWLSEREREVKSVWRWCVCEREGGVGKGGGGKGPRRGRAGDGAPRLVAARCRRKKERSTLLSYCPHRTHTRALPLSLSLSSATHT